MPTVMELGTLQVRHVESEIGYQVIINQRDIWGGEIRRGQGGEWPIKEMLGSPRNENLVDIYTSTTYLEIYELIGDHPYITSSLFQGQQPPPIVIFWHTP